MTAIIHRIGWTLLAIGIVALIAGILLAFAVGTVAVPVAMIVSILLNAAGITLVRWRE